MIVLLRCFGESSTNLFSKLICLILQPVILTVWQTQLLFIDCHVLFYPTHHNRLLQALLTLSLTAVFSQQHYQFPSADSKTEWYLQISLTSSMLCCKAAVDGVVIINL